MNYKKSIETYYIIKNDLISKYKQKILVLDNIGEFYQIYSLPLQNDINDLTIIANSLNCCITMFNKYFTWNEYNPKMIGFPIIIYNYKKIKLFEFVNIICIINGETIYLDFSPKYIKTIINKMKIFTNNMLSIIISYLII
jgi:hypothetical protein